MVEDFESILFRYLTNGIKIKHFKNKDDMVESIKNDCFKVNNGINIDKIIKHHCLSIGIEKSLIKNIVLTSNIESEC